MKWWLGAMAVMHGVVGIIAGDDPMMIMSVVYLVGFLILDRLDEK